MKPIGILEKELIERLYKKTSNIAIIESK